MLISAKHEVCVSCGYNILHCFRVSVHKWQESFQMCPYSIPGNSRCQLEAGHEESWCVPNNFTRVFFIQQIVVIDETHQRINFYGVVYLCLEDCNRQIYLVGNQPSRYRWVWCQGTSALFLQAKMWQHFSTY